jgi:hypothetical protein
VTGFRVALDAKPVGPSAGDIGYKLGIVSRRGKRISLSAPRAGRAPWSLWRLPGGQKESGERVREPGAIARAIPAADADEELVELGAGESPDSLEGVGVCEPERAVAS